MTPRHSRAIRQFGALHLGAEIGARAHPTRAVRQFGVAIAAAGLLGLGRLHPRTVGVLAVVPIAPRRSLAVHGRGHQHTALVGGFGVAHATAGLGSLGRRGRGGQHTVRGLIRHNPLTALALAVVLIGDGQTLCIPSEAVAFAAPRGLRRRRSGGGP